MIETNKVVNIALDPAKLWGPPFELRNEQVIIGQGYCCCGHVRYVTYFDMSEVSNYESYSRHEDEKCNAYFVVCNFCKKQLDPSNWQTILPGLHGVSVESCTPYMVSDHQADAMRYSMMDHPKLSWWKKLKIKILKLLDKF